jgi:hypothetical protein
LKSRHVLLCITISLGIIGSVHAQASLPAFPPVDSQQPQQAPAAQQASQNAQEPATPAAAPDGTRPGQSKNAMPDSPPPKAEVEEAQQTKRILWIMPNYRSVTANTYLPPQSVKEKFWLATQDSFDYSAFIWVGMVAGLSMSQKSEPEFGQGASGYGIYYAHAFADNTIENYLVEAAVPTLTREDPRYYTMGHGGFFKRTAYSFSRLAITRTDSGHETVNLSEIVGAGAAAGIGNAYYPQNQNQWVKTYQRWGSQLIQDGLSNIAKEFWPEINRAVFHNKY